MQEKKLTVEPLPHQVGYEEFLQDVREKTHDFLAKIEWKKRVLARKKAEEDRRKAKEEEEEKEAAKKKENHEKLWEDTREERVTDWRSFTSGKGKNKPKKEKIAGIKRPQQFTEDQEKSYVRRPAQMKK